MINECVYQVCLTNQLGTQDAVWSLKLSWIWIVLETLIKPIWFQVQPGGRSEIRRHRARDGDGLNLPPVILDTRALFKLTPNTSGITPSSGKLQRFPPFSNFCGIIFTEEAFTPRFFFFFFLIEYTETKQWLFVQTSGTKLHHQLFSHFKNVIFTERCHFTSCFKKGFGVTEQSHSCTVFFLIKHFQTQVKHWTPFVSEMNRKAFLIDTEEEKRQNPLLDVGRIMFIEI